MLHSDHADIPEGKILNLLTLGGRKSLELCFVLYGVIWRWRPDYNSFQGYMNDNESEDDACQKYLKSKGLYFSTLDDLAAWAQAHDWPNLEELQPAIEAWKRHKQGG